MRFTTLAIFQITWYQWATCIPAKSQHNNEFAEGLCMNNQQQQQEECNVEDNIKVPKSGINAVNLHQNPTNGTDTFHVPFDSDPGCRLYMAESSIPNAGFGLYTGTDLERGQVFLDGAKENVFHLIDFMQNYERGQIFTVDESRKMQEAVVNKNDNDSYCVIWAREGECETSEEFMLETCERSCAMVKAGLNVEKLMLFDKNKESSCNFWAEEGECESIESGIYMAENCPRACSTKKFPSRAFTTSVIKNYVWAPDYDYSRFEANQIMVINSGIGTVSNAHPGLKNMKIVYNNDVDSAKYNRSSDAGAGAFVDHHVHFKARTDIPAGMEIFAHYGDNYFRGRESELGPVPLSHDYVKADEELERFWMAVDTDRMNDQEAKELYKYIRDSIENPKVQKLLPETFKKAKETRGISSAKLSVPDVVRSSEWLQENGMCVDNIRPGISSIPQAGRGAFATRHIYRGQLIAPMPLLHMDKNNVRKFRGFNEGNSQITLNYSFGHPKSSLLLFPYSPFVTFVNNNADKNKINAKVQWSSSKFHKKSWEETTVKEVLMKDHAGLILDLVATKEIRKDEEIFIDYGLDWDKAWEKHVTTWMAPSSSPDYMPIEVLNTEPVIRTLKEKETRPYGFNVKTFCWLQTKKLLEDISKTEGKVTLNYADYRVSPDTKNDSPADERYTIDCVVEDRMVIADGDSEYRIYIISKRKEDDEMVKVFVNGVPRKEIVFYNDRYTSDLHLENAFRHSIQIPDKIFPTKWMNLI